MDSQTYFTLLLAGVRACEEDLLTSHLFEQGAAGVQEDLNFSQLERHYQPKVIESEIKSLKVYFESPPSPEIFDFLSNRYPHLQIQSEKHEVEDWLEKWKEQWKPFELIPNVWIVPEWFQDSFEAPDGKIIYIEPGMAFGTGTHATTQLAAQLLVELQGKSELKSLLDVGTGSGILAFLAGLIGFEEIYAYDNDPESQRVFLENLAKNPHQQTHWEEKWSPLLTDKVDITVANIIDGVLLSLKDEFQAVNSRYYIFTGILAERENDFLEEMRQDFPLEVLTRVEKDEWIGFLMEKPS